MSKVIAIMDRPSDCQSCAFGICKYYHPLWSRDNPGRKGYYCQLLPPEERQVYDFDYDAKVHIPGCPLKELPESFLSVEKDDWYAGWNSCLEKIMGGAE